MVNPRILEALKKYIKIENVDELKSEYEKLSNELASEIEKVNEIKRKMNEIAMILRIAGVEVAPVAAVTGERTAKGESENRVVGYLKTVPEASLKQIMEATGMPRSTVWHALKRLVAKGVIERDPITGKYKLVQK